MSSHHIVRDEQEPALIIADLTAASLSLIEPLLEWCPTIIVLESCLETVKQWGIKIDIVVVTRTQLESVRAEVEEQMPIKLLTCEKEVEQLRTALLFLTTANYQAVNIVTPFNNNLLKLLEPLTQSIELGLINNDSKTNYFNGHFKKWMLQEILVTTIPTQPEQTFKTKGLKQGEEGHLSGSEGVIEVKSSSPFWLTQKL